MATAPVPASGLLSDPACAGDLTSDPSAACDRTSADPSAACGRTSVTIPTSDPDSDRAPVNALTPDSVGAGDLTCDMPAAVLRWAARTPCFLHFLQRCRVAQELAAELATVPEGECLCGWRCRHHQEQLDTQQARGEQQAAVIEHYRRTLVPQLRGDVARVTSESRSLAWRLRHAEKELTMKDSHIALLEKQRQELRGQLDAGKIDVPSFVLSMRQTLAQLETNLAQSHEERCKLFSDVSMLKTEKALVVRELRDTERRVESLQQEAAEQKESYQRQLNQLAEQLAHAQSRAGLLTDQLRQQEAQTRLERQKTAQEVAAVHKENSSLREQIDTLFSILAKKDETAYKLCSKLLTLKESRDRKDTEVLETMSKYQTVIGKVLDQLNDVNMENLLLVSNRLEQSQPQQYKMLLESLKFKIFLETENASMTQECHRLRYENSFLQRENQRILEQLQDVQLRLLPQELRDEHVVLREGRLTRLRRSSSTQTEPERRDAAFTTEKDMAAFQTGGGNLETSPSQSYVSICSLPEAQQDLLPESAAEQRVKNSDDRSRSPPTSSATSSCRPRRSSRRERRRSTRGVTWGQLLEAGQCPETRLDPTAVTQMMQLAVAQSCELDKLDDSLQLAAD